MLGHTGVIGGGFLGVDVFFTLSGFLITTLLLEELVSTGAVTFRGFYVRRALRLLPALAPVVVIAGGAMLADQPTGAMLAFVLSVVFYSANWAGIAGLPQGMLATRGRCRSRSSFTCSGRRPSWPSCACAAGAARSSSSC